MARTDLTPGAWSLRGADGVADPVKRDGIWTFYASHEGVTRIVSVRTGMSPTRAWAAAYLTLISNLARETS